MPIAPDLRATRARCAGWLGFAATLIGLAACRAEEPRATLRAGDLLILDADAGGALADTAAPQHGAAQGASGAAPIQRAGLIFRAAQSSAGWSDPGPFAGDERWHEPVDLLVLPDHSLFVLEQQWSPRGDLARGAIFRLRPGAARAELWWSDDRTRQLVSFVRGEDGTVYVSDRGADPLGLGRPTGCVFAIPLTTDSSLEDGGTAGLAWVAAAGPELEAPGALLLQGTSRLLLMDANSNPRGLTLPDGRAASPGVLFALAQPASAVPGQAPASLEMLLQPEETVSPIALLARGPDELLLIDANADTTPGRLGGGVIFRVDLAAGRLHRLLDAGAARTSAASSEQSAEALRVMIDPVGGDVLEDGRIVLADANADPLRLGADETGKGVYGTGRGAVLIVDLDARHIEVLLASADFVTPLGVRRVRP